MTVHKIKRIRNYIERNLRITFKVQYIKQIGEDIKENVTVILHKYYKNIKNDTFIEKKVILSYIKNEKD